MCDMPRSCDMPCPYVWALNPLSCDIPNPCVMALLMCISTHSSVWHATFVGHMSPDHVCAIAYSSVSPSRLCHASSMRGLGRIKMRALWCQLNEVGKVHGHFIDLCRIVLCCDMTYSYEWHDSYICVPWCVPWCVSCHCAMTHACRMHICTVTHACVRHNSFVPWVMYMCEMSRS